jgi:hypothetical protein
MLLFFTVPSTSTKINQYLYLVQNQDAPVVVAAVKNIIHSWTGLEEIVLKENYTLFDRRAIESIRGVIR